MSARKSPRKPKPSKEFTDWGDKPSKHRKKKIRQKVEEELEEDFDEWEYYYQ